MYLILDKSIRPVVTQSKHSKIKYYAWRRPYKVKNTIPAVPVFILVFFSYCELFPTTHQRPNQPTNPSPNPDPNPK